jgi:mRNA interferase RelE/StbE
VPFRLEFVSSARLEFLALPVAIRERIDKRLLALTENPRPPGVKALKGKKDFWSIRIGDYRVVYAIADNERLLTVTRVRPRASVYRGL